MYVDKNSLTPVTPLRKPAPKHQLQITPLPRLVVMVSEGKQKAFRDWLQQQGGYANPKVSLFHELPSGDRGVYATADIKEGEQLLLVPVQCTLHLNVTDARWAVGAAGQQEQQQQRQQAQGDGAAAGRRCCRTAVRMPAPGVQPGQLPDHLADSPRLNRRPAGGDD